MNNGWIEIGTMKRFIADKAESYKLSEDIVNKNCGQEKGGYINVLDKKDYPYQKRHILNSWIPARIKEYREKNTNSSITDDKIKLGYAPCKELVIYLAESAYESSKDKELNELINKAYNLIINKKMPYQLWRKEYMNRFYKKIKTIIEEEII